MGTYWRVGEEVWCYSGSCVKDAVLRGRGRGGKSTSKALAMFQVRASDDSG